MTALRAAALGVLLGVAAGFAAGVGWGSRDAAREVAAAAPPASGDSRDAPAQRAQLEEEVARLEHELAQALALRDDAGAAAPPPAEADQDPAATRGAELEAAGWLPVDLERLRAEVEAYELERLYLRDQAVREGWRNSSRFREEQARLLADLHGRLGDEDYDAALYAMGRENRVGVRSLLDGSPAADAGLRAGDEILSYDGERIYDGVRLVRLTLEGERGQPVELRVLRGGEELRLFVPRGPLGARVRSAARPPSRS